MEVVLTIAAPVFGLAILGYLAQAFGWLKEGASQTLATFVFNFAVPALLFRSTAGEPLPHDLPFTYLLAYYLPTLAIYGLGVLGSRYLFRRTKMESVIGGMANSYSNLVMFGMPLVLTTWGTVAAQPFFLLVAFHALILFTITTVWLEMLKARSDAQGEGLAALTAKTVKSLLANPIVISLAAGILYGQTGWGLDPAIDRFLELLGQAVTPVALFGTGAALRQYRLGGDLMEATAVSLSKLVIHPLLVWAVMTFLFDLPPLWVAVGTLSAAMPVGVNVYLFSERYGVFQRRAGSVVLITSGLAMLTVTLVLILLGVSG
ncbi:AEC family transporter [Limibacillus halophilus]|jgi:malonate transporter